MSRCNSSRLSGIWINNTIGIHEQGVYSTLRFVHSIFTSVVSEIKQEFVSELIRNILHKSAPDD